jgi:triacylglycerol lipase
VQYFGWIDIAGSPVAYWAAGGSTMGSSVSMYFPSGFNLTDVQTCAAMVSAAYDQYIQFAADGSPQPNDFDWVWTGPSSISDPLPIWWIETVVGVKIYEPIGFLGTDGAGNAYLVFRGTMSKDDDGADSDIRQTPYAPVTGFGNVDQGYYNIYRNLVLPTASTGATTTLLEGINALTGVSTFFFTGHSLGAGLSSLAVPDVSSNSNITPSSATMVHYNFGSPRVGDITFAGAINSASVPTYRVVNTEDLVPVAPPPEGPTGLFQHIGTPVDFTVNYGSAVSNHSMANTYAYAVNNPSDPYNSANSADANPVDGRGALSRQVLVVSGVATMAASTPAR